MRSIEKRELSYLYYQSFYRQQNWRDADLPWAAPTHKVTSPFGQVVLQDYVTSFNHYIATSTVPMAINLSKEVTQLQWVPTQLFTWALCEKLKPYISIIYVYIYICIYIYNIYIYNIYNIYIFIYIIFIIIMD